MITSRELNFYKALFLLAALWNLTGVGFGYFNPAYTFQNFFHRELIDPLFLSIYKGAWGTTFVYFFGYLIVAYKPLRHQGIVIVGGIGKVGYVVNLINLYMMKIADPVVFIVIVGDLIFLILFAIYFFRLYKTKTGII